tara:strand:+ start:319 stop:537 length:219 start_codon:yes stop_codon:yes gene_type:complete
MEDFFTAPELPETSVLKANADVVSQIAEAIATTEDLELSKGMLELLNKHSNVVLETSHKIMCKNKMHLQAVQ